MNTRFENYGIQNLEQAIAEIWQKIFSSSQAFEFTSTIMNSDKRLYALYLTQVYHYASYTPRSLAKAGANQFNNDTRLMHHFFEHAIEETGHELMALTDLKNLGINYDDDKKNFPPALPGTKSIIAYIDFLALSESPYQILGYSYWIEKPYQYILPFMNHIKNKMNLNDSQLNFYNNHIEIDKKHGKEIEQIITKICNTSTHWNKIEEVALTTMRYLFNLLVEIIEEYKKLINGQNSEFEILNQLVLK